MGIGVSASTIRTLTELEREMVSAQRVVEAIAIREALAVLAGTSRGWLSTGQAAERLGVSIPTVEEWIQRGALAGEPVGSKWRVSEESVEKVLQIRELVAGMEEDGYPTDEEIQELVKKARRELWFERKRQVG